MTKPSSPGFVERLLGHWRDNGVPYLTGVKPGELADAERRFGRLPADLKAYFVATDGTTVAGSAEEDGRGFRFFTLRQCYAEDNPPRIVLFATWFEGIAYYGIGVGESSESEPSSFGAVSLLCDGYLKIADSFAQFVDLYLANDPRLHLNGARALHGLPPRE